MYTKPTLTIPNATIDGDTVTGEFVFPTNIRYEVTTEMDALFQSSGSTRVIASLILDYIDDGQAELNEGIRQQVSIDVGQGLHTVTLDFKGYTGSPHRWGDTGDGGSPTDATGEDLHAQICVLDKYIQSATIDSENPATLEIAEYSSDGRYDPLNVVVRNPDFMFDSVEESSIWDGSMTFVETVDIQEYLSGANQSEK